MPNRLALVVGVESPLPAPHAEADALAFARALEAAGFDHQSVTMLVGPQATRTAVESRLRKLAKAPAADLLVVFVATAGFTDGGAGYLACHDTQPDDLAETGLPLRALLDALAAARAHRLAVFLDHRGEGFPLGPVEAFFAGRPASACFVSRSGGEASHVSGALKAGVWAHHVAEAFAGRAPAALDGRALTAASLQAYLEQELPRALRATFREAPPQAPRLFGPEGRLVLAEVAPAADRPTADPRLQPLRRGSLRGETTAKVKSLGGYRKFHRLPERVNASSRKFVADLAHDDVQRDVDEVYAAVRESLGYRRRDVEGSADRGTGVVRTPDFEYSVSVDLADDDPTTAVWRREVAAIKNPEVVLSKPFQQVFGGVFDTLVFEFAGPFDLEAWVDRIEEELPDGVKLRTASDCSSCDVQVRGKACVVRLFRDRVEVQGQKTPGSKGLVEAFLSFQDLFTGRRDLQELPLLSSKD
jgi:hypothetical protein